VTCIFRSDPSVADSKHLDPDPTFFYYGADMDIGIVKEKSNCVICMSELGTVTYIWIFFIILILI